MLFLPTLPLDKDMVMVEAMDVVVEVDGLMIVVIEQVVTGQSLRLKLTGKLCATLGTTTGHVMELRRQMVARVPQERKDCTNVVGLTMVRPVVKTTENENMSLNP